MAAANPEIEADLEKEMKYLKVLEDLKERREDCKDIKLQIELLKAENEKNLREKEMALRERKEIEKEKQNLNESQKRINRLVDENEQLTAKNLNLHEEIQKIDRMLATITQGKTATTIRLRTAKNCLRLLHGIVDIILPQTEESKKIMVKIEELEKDVNDRQIFQLKDFTQDIYDALNEIIEFDQKTRVDYG